MTVKTKVRCPACGVAIKVKPEHAEKRGKCPACKESFLIQLSEESAGATLQPSPQAIAETIDLRREASDSPEDGIDDLPPLRPLGNLGRFQLCKLLGQGSFGRVYLAYDPQLDREVALKVPTFEAHDSRKIQRFVAEAKSAARLRHPNIVPTYESGSVNGQYFIASQYIAGETLAARIARNPPDFRQAAEWVRQLAEGLAYAHAQGIVHRDIKPANIMLDEHDVPQIMDFGLAKRMNDDAAMTIDGTVLGTPAYMPPEQARGDTAQVNAASDQYSLGVVLYELLTGERPFTGTSYAVLSNVLTQEAPTPRDRRKEIPRDLDAICQVAMHRQQDQRYASTSEFSQDLSRWLNEATIKARTVSLAERFARWVKREPRVACLTVAVILLLILGAGISFTLAVRANRNLQLANSHARNLGVALKSARDEQERANYETARANSETKRAREAEAAAKDRAAEALAARNDATKARELADDRSKRLQAVLDELGVSKSDVKAKIAELTAATEALNKTELSRAQAEYDSKLAAARVATNEYKLDDARRLLEECPTSLRNEDWKQLLAQVDLLTVTRIESPGGDSIALDPAGSFVVVGKRGSNKLESSFRMFELRSGELRATFPGSQVLGFVDNGVLVTQSKGLTLQKETAIKFPANDTILRALNWNSIGYSADAVWIVSSSQTGLFLNALKMDTGTCRFDAKRAIRVAGDYALHPWSVPTIVPDFAREKAIFWDDRGDAYLISSGRATLLPRLKDRQTTPGMCELRNRHIVCGFGKQIQVSDGEQIVRTIDAPQLVNTVAVCPRGFYVAGAWKDEMRIWRILDGVLVRTYRTDSTKYQIKKINDIEFNSGGVAWVWDTGAGYWDLPELPASTAAPDP